MSALPRRAVAAVPRTALVVLALAGTPLGAQQPVPPPRAPAVRLDTVPAHADTITRVRGDSVRIRPPITPSGAFLRSLAIPGWGQARLNRNITGGLFLAFEGLAGAMVWKSTWQLEIARSRGKWVQSHRQEREDWIVLLVFNHFMSGAEAYVSAHLYDFPAALHLERLPGGRTGIGVTVPLR